MATVEASLLASETRIHPRQPGGILAVARFLYWGLRRHGLKQAEAGTKIADFGSRAATISSDACSSAGSR